MGTIRKAERRMGVGVDPTTVTRASRETVASKLNLNGSWRAPLAGRQVVCWSERQVQRKRPAGRAGRDVNQCAPIRPGNPGRSIHLAPATSPGRPPPDPDPTSPVSPDMVTDTRCSEPYPFHMGRLGSRLSGMGPFRMEEGRRLASQAIRPTPCLMGFEAMPQSG